MPQTQSMAPTNITSGPAVAVTAVASIDWVVPAAVRQITFITDQVAIPLGALLRLGTSGGIVSTGYASTCVFAGTTTGARTASTIGLLVPDSTNLIAAFSFCILTRVGSSNSWVMAASSQIATDYMAIGGGRIALAGELTTIRFQTPSGNFTAGGTAQLLWEF